MDRRTNALPDRPTSPPTNRPTNGHSQLQRCFVAPKKEQGAEYCGDRDRFSSKILPILEKKASPSMQFHKCGSPRCKLEQQMDKQMDGQSQYTCKKKSRLVQFDEKKTSQLKRHVKNFGLLVVGRVFLRSYYLGNTQGLQYVFSLLYSKLMYLIVFGYSHIFTN